MSQKLSCSFCGEDASKYSVAYNGHTYCSMGCYYEDLEYESGPYEPDEDEWRFPND
jgi:hypothetical protein